jgi:hypothetical protein
VQGSREMALVQVRGRFCSRYIGLFDAQTPGPFLKFWLFGPWTLIDQPCIRAHSLARKVALVN